MWSVEAVVHTELLTETPRLCWVESLEQFLFEFQFGVLREICHVTSLLTVEVQRAQPNEV